jgi:hypothetical protein
MPSRFEFDSNSSIARVGRRDEARAKFGNQPILELQAGELTFTDLPNHAEVEEDGPLSRPGIFAGRILSAYLARIKNSDGLRVIISYNLIRSRGHSKQ